jgi:hypothetical protein
VVHGDQGAVGALDYAVCQHEAFQGLGQRHLVDHIAVNVQEGARPPHRPGTQRRQRSVK